MTKLATGGALGRYELLVPLAQGGMAQVWAARLRGTRGFQKLVAIKTILPGALDSARLQQMFLAEAQLAAGIQHPNVVATLELGEQDDVLYLVMEWVDGDPVSRLLARAHAFGGLPLPLAVDLIAQACQGLHAAHELRDDSGELLGVVHRDVSPQNLLVTLGGVAKLVDFGVAKATARAGNLTAVGEVKGKVAYMAPEQVQSQAIDRRTDVFALGILGYLLTTGRHPFRGASAAATIRSIVDPRPPAAPTVFVGGYPPALEAVIMKALEKNPAGRFATAAEMLSALSSALPEPLDTGMRTSMTAFLTRVLGQSADARRVAIRSAQEAADRTRQDGAPNSVGSLRAISLDSVSGAALPPAPTTPPIPEGGGVPYPAASSSKGYVALALGGLAALAAGLALEVGSPRAPRAPQAASPLPAAAVLPGVRGPIRAVEAQPSDPPVSVSALPLETAAPRRTPRSPGPALPEPPPLPSPIRTSASASSAAPSVDPFDRSQFGGRH